MSRKCRRNEIRVCCLKLVLKNGFFRVSVKAKFVGVFVCITWSNPILFKTLNGVDKPKQFLYLLLIYHIDSRLELERACESLPGAFLA